MFKSAFFLGLVSLTAATAGAEDIYKCGETYQNRPCLAQTGQLVRFDKRFSKTGMVTSNPESDEARARFEFQRDTLLDELISEKPKIAESVQGGELQALSQEAQNLNDALNQRLEQKGKQLVYGDINRLKNRLQVICNQPAAADDRIARDDCEKSLELIGEAERKTADYR